MLLQRITNDDIKYFVQSGEGPNWNVTQYPFHTQSTEIYVKLVSEALQKVYEPESRYGYISKTLQFGSGLSV